MITTGITKEAFMSLLEVKLNANYTNEQKALIESFGDGPTFCFADPGTGKTYTAIGGLLTAELFKGIPGQNIYALSFTRLATGELAVRHEAACQKLGISRQVNFATLHSLCRTILLDNYRLLGMTKFESTGALTMERAYRIIEDSCAEWGVAIEPRSIRSVVNACSTLNAALIFDQDTVMTKMVFKDCHIDYELFERLRGLLFSYSLLTETISVSDLLLYTVMLLTRHPEISQKFKEKCKLMLVDEAQDLSLLQLRIISLLTDNPVLIGDMKQQIYGFNGACQEVVSEFHKLYPTCTDMKLTQSFRCKNEIAEYAKKIIQYNDIGGADYKGTGDGGSVHVIAGLYENGADIVHLSEHLHKEFVTNNNHFPKEYLFLVRNNISIIPIVEELFKQGLPFRVNKYKKACEVPVIKELCELVQLCEQPYNVNNVLALRYLIPEFREYTNIYTHPYYQICKKTGCNIFEVNYQFRNIPLASKAMNILVETQEMLHNGATTGELFNHLWPLFEETWLSANKWKLEAKPEYYLASVNTLTRKPYQKFIQDETLKMDIIKESERYGRGIRCYTMHASKGLEADIVYIIDADEGLIPNDKKLKEMMDKKCDMDAARAIREERSLCFVACTRAREELNIIYNDKPSSMLLGENQYAMFDSVYSYYKTVGDDINSFEKFTERYIPHE
jgi:DNA helicase-2/ATP-dependent DNA helicase PcrA